MSHLSSFSNGISLKEMTTPSALADWGKVYTKDDNKIYFQDGAGNEHEINLTGNYEAEMYLDENAIATVIETANTPIMVRNCTAGALAGFTFNAGSTGAITAFADYGGTVAGTVLVTSAGHGLATGDDISIRGTTDYNGIFTITYVGVDTFYITDTWVNDNGASDWDEGSYLLAGTGASGDYAMAFNISATCAAASEVIAKIYINSTACTKCVSKRKYAINDYGNLPGTANITIAVGDKVYFTLESDATANITCQYGNLNFHRT